MFVKVITIYKNIKKINITLDSLYNKQILILSLI